MEYTSRSLTPRLLRMTEVFPVVAVTGARQVGKSTLLAHALPDWSSVVLDPISDIHGARADPELFLDSHRGPLIIDEIQYAPELAAALKRRVDQDRRPGQYVLTGSQQWEVFSGLAESLAGRVVFLDLEGFSLAERADQSASSWLAHWLESPQDLRSCCSARLPLDHSVMETVWRGSLPQATQLPLDVLGDFHAAYRRTYVERDVRLMADVSDWQLFGRFFRLCGALTSQEINYAHLGRELGLSPKTGKHWLSLLQATFQWYEVPAWSGNLLKRISGRPKGYIGDTGTAAAAQAIATPQVLGGHPLWGPLFETAVVNDVRRQASLLSPKPNIYHWRSHTGAEVDLVLEWSGRFFPLEIKAGSHPSKKDARGLKAFREAHTNHDIAPGLIIAPTTEAYAVTPTVTVLPWDASPKR